MIRSAIEELNQVAHALAAEIYKQTGSQEAGAGGPSAGPADQGPGTKQAGSQEGAVEADFEVVDDDEKK